MRHPASAIRPTRRSAGTGRSRVLPRRAVPASNRHDHRATIWAHRGHAKAPDIHPITLAAATWLACGIVLLGLTPLPLHDAALGWSPAFWGLAAPLLPLLARYACARKSRSQQNFRPKPLS